ncbi:MAG: MotA/TolQ/ExbB proton channel family protein [Pseudomonadota bacterium]
MSLLKSLRAPLAAALVVIATLATTTAPAPAFAQASAPAAEAPAPAPAAAPAPAPAEPVVAKEEVMNPYGLEALWVQGDFVARGTLIIMIIMSMGSWYIIFTKLFEQQKMLKAANAVGEGFWKAGSMKQATGTLDEGSAFRYIAEQGVKADEHHEGTLVESIDRHTWISMSVERAVSNINSRLQDGLAFLATVGSTAPFVGLFGTVWGIYHALTAIGIAGQASIDKVAGPVGEALIMTAFGLAVAVPAVMGYNWLIRRNKTVMEKIRAFSGDVHNVLLAGKR